MVTKNFRLLHALREQTVEKMTMPTWHKATAKHTSQHKMASVFVMHYKDTTFVFERGVDMLSEEMFYDRCWFIILNSHKPDVEGLADIFIASRYNGTRYSANIMDRLGSMALP